MIYDGQSIINDVASAAVFQLVGGYYTMDAIATWGGGSLKLQKRAGDGTTYFDVPNSTLSANGITGLLPLAVGTYKFVQATATGVYAQLTRVAVG